MIYLMINTILEQKDEEWVSIGKDYPIIYHKFTNI